MHDKRPKKKSYFNLTAADPARASGVRLGTVVAIRWLAIAGQSIALLFVAQILGLKIALAPALGVVGVSAIFNVWLTLARKPNEHLSDKRAALHLGFDLTHLGVLLFLTGGLANPFSMLLLAPAAVSASILTRGSTIALGILALVIVILLSFTPFDLPWREELQSFPPLYINGVIVALTFTIIFLTAYVAQLGRESRYRARALAATQIALEREQKLASLGGLAAAAAHELGTPLGTIMLVVKNQLETTKPGDATQEDLELILGEIERCRGILATLSQESFSQDHFAVQPLEAILREAAGPHENRGIQIDYPPSGGNTIMMERRPEIIHALRNLIENAVDFAKNTVSIHIEEDRSDLNIYIKDDGPGFNPSVIRRLGEPYVTTKNKKGDGLGLGLFIARTMLSHTDADVFFGENVGGGAEVRIKWPKDQAPII